MAQAPIIERVTGNQQTTTSGAGPDLIVYSTASGRGYQVWAQISAISTGATEGAGWILSATFKNVGGSLTKVGSTTAISTHKDAGTTAWLTSINAVGTDIEVQIVGEAATTIDWVCYAQILVSVA